MVHCWLWLLLRLLGAGSRDDRSLFAPALIPATPPLGRHHEASIAIWPANMSISIWGPTNIHLIFLR